MSQSKHGSLLRFYLSLISSWNHDSNWQHTFWRVKQLISWTYTNQFFFLHKFNPFNYSSFDCSYVFYLDSWFWWFFSSFIGFCILFCSKNCYIWFQRKMDRPQGGTAKSEKRKVPPLLEKILAVDVQLTKKFVSFSLNFVPIRSLKTHCKFLEVSISIRPFWHKNLKRTATKCWFFFINLNPNATRLVFVPWIGLVCILAGSLLDDWQSKILSAANESAVWPYIGYHFRSKHQSSNTPTTTKHWRQHISVHKSG